MLVIIQGRKGEAKRRHQDGGLLCLGSLADRQVVEWGLPQAPGAKGPSRYRISCAQAQGIESTAHSCDGYNTDGKERPVED